MASDDSKKDKQEDWEKVRHTATRTEVQTSIDEAAQELLNQADKAQPALIVIQGDLIGKVFRLKQGKNVIGRHATCQVQLSQRAVSSSHAEIRVTGDSVILEDMKSTNGTVVNKGKIDKPVALNSGDLIRIGSSVFRYVDRLLDATFSESLHQQMTRDALTGIFNRAYVMKALASSLEIAKTGYPLSMVMFDLDHFKRVNDTYGHLAGDYVLKETCRVINEGVVRSEDVFGRYGGEEFIVIMPDCPLDAAEGLAERIRSTIESHPFEFEGQRLPVTTSLGVASWIPKYENPEAFIAAVDELLYRSKQEGRNRVSVLKR